MSRLLLLALTGLLTGTMASAQQAEEVVRPKRAPGAFELNLGAGAIMPMSDYAGTTGKANTGFNIGLDGNYYFLANNRLGLSLGLGYQQQGKDTIVDNGAYSFNIKNGYTELYQKPNPAFRQFGLFIGPVYKVLENEHWSAEVRLRLGFVNVSNPDYYQAVWARNPFNANKYEGVIVSATAYNYEGSTRLALMPGIGAGITYRFTPKLGINLRADYYQALGRNGKVGAVEREMKWQDLINNGITFSDKTHNNSSDFASDYFVEKATTAIQVLNVNIGLQYRF